MPQTGQSVHKRHVFYIPGHDPAGGRRYREIYRAEAAKQAATSGYEIDVKGIASGAGRYAWTVHATIDGQHTETTVEYLQWNDLVRKSLTKSLLSSYLLMLRTLWTYTATGAYRAIYRVRPVMLFTTVYPFLAYLAPPLIGAVIGVLLAWLLGLFIAMPPFGTLALVALCIGAALFVFSRYDRKYYISYLVLAYSYFSTNRGGVPTGLGARSAAFERQVAQALESDVDEVLIVGHSAGTGIGVHICAQLLRAGLVPPGKLALLGIGSVIQLVSFLPKADWLRADLNLLARTDHLAWVEVTAPSDGMCFALADPVATTGVDVPEEEKCWPLVFSASYYSTLSDSYRADPEFTQFRKHFQYIYAFDKPRDYDYFQITAGPVRLADRYAGRAHSPQRITRAVGPYRDMA